MNPDHGDDKEVRKMGQTVSLTQPKNKIYSLAMNLQQLRRIFANAKDGQYVGVDNGKGKEFIDQLVEKAAASLAALLVVLPDGLELEVEDIRELDNVIVASSMEEAQEKIDNMEHKLPPKGTKIH